MAIMLNASSNVYEHIFFSASQPPDSSTLSQIAGIAVENAGFFLSTTSYPQKNLLTSDNYNILPMRRPTGKD